MKTKTKPELEEAVRRGEDLEGADLMEAWLHRAQLAGAKLRDANLQGVDLEGANLREAHLVGANLAVARLVGAHLNGADLEDANLEGANLAVARLMGADLNGANLRDANLVDADLSNADLKDATLSGAILTNATASSANLDSANLRGANLMDAVLDDANLRRADLLDANLRNASLLRANFRYADLSGANLRGTDLRDAVLQASLIDADLTDADLTRADLRNADLTLADLMDAILEEALLTDADLTNADLTNANLTNADLTNADLTGADMTGAILDGANLTGTSLESLENTEPEQMEAFGKQHRAVLALQTVESPVGLPAFKKQFPVAFEILKKRLQGLKGNTLTPELTQTILSEHGMRWTVTRRKWTSKLQRLSANPNTVLQLNIDKTAITTDPDVLKALRAIEETSYRSMHPVHRSGSSLLTVGWTRFDDGKDVLLIEEVQSDLPTVRTGTKNPQFIQNAAEKGVDISLIEQALDLMEPFTKRFYYDALSLMFHLAQESGRRVEMLRHEQKKSMRSPVWVYEELPKSMGMRKCESQSIPELGTVWCFDPAKVNPARRKTRTRLPKSFMWDVPPLRFR